MQTKFAFIGLILGSIPLLIKQTNKEKLHFKHIMFFLLSFVTSLFLIYLENFISSIYASNLNFIYLFISGFAMSIGVVVPRC